MWIFYLFQGKIVQGSGVGSLLWGPELGTKQSIFLGAFYSNEGQGCSRSVTEGGGKIKICHFAQATIEVIEVPFP